MALIEKVRGLLRDNRNTESGSSNGGFGTQLRTFLDNDKQFAQTLETQGLKLYFRKANHKDENQQRHNTLDVVVNLQDNIRDNTAFMKVLQRIEGIPTDRAIYVEGISDPHVQSRLQKRGYQQISRDEQDPSYILPKTTPQTPAVS